MRDDAENPVDTALRLLGERGAGRYGDEPVSVLEHSLQCAALAEAAGAPPALVAAALLHDLGHVLHDDETAARHGRDMRHEVLAADWLETRFANAVVAPVRLHVDAKRWLCATEPGYAATLSPASVRSLALQGGAYAPEEAAAFMRRPFAADGIALRRWDDEAKIANLPTPPLEHYRPALAAGRRARPAALT